MALKFWKCNLQMLSSPCISDCIASEMTDQRILDTLMSHFQPEGTQKLRDNAHACVIYITFSTFASFRRNAIRVKGRRFPFLLCVVTKGSRGLVKVPVTSTPIEAFFSAKGHFLFFSDLSFEVSFVFFGFLSRPISKSRCSLAFSVDPGSRSLHPPPKGLGF